MLPALSVANEVIAIAVEMVPIIFARRCCGLILRSVSALNGDHVAAFHARAALRRGDFGGAFAHDHTGLRVGVDLNAIAAFFKRTHGNVGRINFGVGLATFKHVIVRQPLAHLDLSVGASEVGDFCR